MVDVHVRGQMGVQLCQALVGLAKVYDAEGTIKNARVVVNRGGVKYSDSEKLKHFIRYDSPLQIVETVGSKKNKYWWEDLPLWYKHKDAVVEEIELSLFPYTRQTATPLVHVRGKDKALLSADGYAKLAILSTKHLIEEYDAEHYPVEIIGDDPNLLSEVVKTVRSLSVSVLPSIFETGAVGDWMHVLTAPKVFCTASSFVLSTLLVDKDKTVRVAAPHLCRTDTAPGDYPAVEAFRHFCPNLEWISEL